VELTEFQEDAIPRIFSRLQKYRCILIADSVGTGKTWIAKKIIEEFGFYRRKRFLVICPA
jgi:superfamily II DNA or RNA helicase